MHCQCCIYVTVGMKGLIPVLNKSEKQKWTKMVNSLIYLLFITNLNVKLWILRMRKSHLPWKTFQAAVNASFTAAGRIWPKAFIDS